MRSLVRSLVLRSVPYLVGRPRRDDRWHSRVTWA
jgi:hypothetical protein